MSYLIFRKVIFCMNDGHHLHSEGFISILNLCYFINSTSTRTIQSKHEIEKLVRSNKTTHKISNETLSDIIVLDLSSVKTQ